MRVRDDQIRELLDAETIDEVALRRNLRDIRHINALLGWTNFTTQAVANVVKGRAQFSLLDVASGSADIPLSIARWATRSGIRADIVASDLSAQIVAIAHAETANTRNVRVEQLDALDLPYGPRSFDIVLCTLALHHFAPDDAVKLLSAMARVGRRVLVFDLTRDRLALLGAHLLTRVALMDGMTRHDAPASVRRAYSAPELRVMAMKAGLTEARVWVGFPFRLALDASGFA